MVAGTDAVGRLRNISPVSSSRRINLSENIIGGLVAMADAAVTFLMGAVILVLYVDTSEVDLALYAVALATTTCVVLNAFHVARLYTFERIVAPWSQLSRITGACAMAFLILVAVAFVFKASESFSRLWVILWFGNTALLVLASRALIAWLIDRAAKRGLLTRRIVVYGTNEIAREFITNLQRSGQPWNEVVGVFDDRTNRVGPAGQLFAVGGDLHALLETARRQHVDEILVTLPWAGPNSRIDSVLRTLSVLPARVNLYVCDNLAKYLNKGVRTEHGITVTPVYERPMTGWQALVKRVFDLTVSSLVLLLVLPVFLIIAVAIKLDSPGPIFFRQHRFGFNDELIPVWKFRTMYRDQTDNNAERLATIDDPRITRVGHFLRRTSLDEIPQLFNVVSGSMSLVGPRPHATRAKADGRLYQEVIEGYGSRHRVKPGITGWAQVNGWRGETDTADKIIKRVEHDLHYISNWSLRLDIDILLRTVQVVLKGDNAH